MYIYKIRESLFIFFVFYQNIHEGDGGIFHIVHDGVDTGEKVVVEHLEDHGGDQTEHGGQQSHFHTAGDDGRGDITCALTIIESRHHTDDRSQELQRRGEREKQE